MLALGVAAAISCLGVIIYWLLVITEGTYLGTRVVVWLYDWTAKKYDRIKDLHYVNEALHLGLPLANALAPVREPLILDVATGTGRVPIALVHRRDLESIIVGVDRSRRMLAEARKALQDLDGRVSLIRQDALALSFDSEAFDCVTCLESLEFMGNPRAVIGEMVRVLKPGGILLLSNRVGVDTWFFPRRLCGRGRLEGYLSQLDLEKIDTRRWQVHYDLTWARKSIAASTIQLGD